MKQFLLFLTVFLGCIGRIDNGISQGKPSFSACIDGITDKNISKLRLLESREIKILLDNAPLKISNVEIVSFTFSIIPKKSLVDDNSAAYSETVAGFKITRTIIQHCNAIKPGDMVEISKITMKWPDGTTEHAGGISYTIH